jgi:hypothetical protein
VFGSFKLASVVIVKRNWRILGLILYLEVLIVICSTIFMQLFCKKESKIECSVGKTITEAQYTKKKTLL